MNRNDGGKVKYMKYSVGLRIFGIWFIQVLYRGNIIKENKDVGF